MKKCRTREQGSKGDRETGGEGKRETRRKEERK